MSNMKKSSRFWWLHGAILLSAAIGCKSCPGGSCGNSSGTPATGPYGSASGSMYSQSGAPSYGSMAGAQGMPSGTGAFSSTPNAGYAMPNTSSSMSAMSPGTSGMSGMGGVR
jgi:hypothetical protein